jgi:hypothetical protein
MRRAGKANPGSPDARDEFANSIARYPKARIGDDLRGPDSLGTQLHRPDRLASALQSPLPGADSH